MGIQETKILIVEDGLDMQLVLKAIFKGSSYKLSSASSVREARKLFEEGPFDIVLLDIILPDEDGLVLCNELQSNPSTQHIPVIVISADSSVAQKVVAFSMGADDYLVKPVNPQELRARIASKVMKMTRVKKAA